MCIVTLSCCGIRNSERNPQIVNGIRSFWARIPLKFADSTYILRIPLTFCGIHSQLRNPEQLAIFACCGIRTKTNVATKFTLQVLVRGIPEKFCKRKPLTFWNMFKDLSLESRSIQTQNGAPIQCTV